MSLLSIRGRRQSAQSGNGEFCLRIRRDPESSEFTPNILEPRLAPADLAIVLVKAWQTESISGFLTGYLNPGGTGDLASKRAGQCGTAGRESFPGSTAEGATLLGPGHVKAGGSGPTHVVAPEWVVDLLQSAGFESYRCNPDEAESLLWGKLSVSCGINALTALLRIPNGELLKRPAATELMVRAAMECAAVARAKGIGLPFPDPALHVKEVAERTAANKSSMLQDILRGAPTECDAINGAVVREGRRVGSRRRRSTKYSGSLCRLRFIRTGASFR